jgi:hypothetical protein
MTMRARLERTPVDPPTAAGRDPALLLHVDVDELTGPVSLVPHDRVGGTVQVRQSRQAVSAQHPVHRRGRFPQRPGDSVRTLEPVLATADDRLLTIRAQAPGCAVRPTGTIGQPSSSFVPKSPQPLMSSGRRASLGLGRRRHRPPQPQHPIDEQLPTLDRQLRPRMSHEGLPPDWLHPVEQGGSHAMNNVLGNYN